MRHAWAALGALLLAALLTMPVHAGLFDDEEARNRIEQLRVEVADLGKRADTVNRNQIGFANQVESIKADIAKLRGQIEVLTYELEAAQKRQKDFYVDLDNRLRKLETPRPKPNRKRRSSIPHRKPAITKQRWPT
jgi:septal ring factor EnvC (AmiA/AmiB activator)